jgi:hypothetical protein
MRDETLLLNGVIHTFDPRRPRAEAVYIADGRIEALGASGEMRALAGPQAREIDLAGRSVIPGLQDAHVHLLWYGLSLLEVQLAGAISLHEALGRIADGARGLAPSQWLRGRGWDHNIWPEATRPSRQDLDRILPDRPALLSSKDGHSIWVNSAALALAGVTRHTPDPAGGQILRDAQGEPTGILTENAQALVKAVVPRPDAALWRRAALLAMADAARLGVTTVHNCEGAESLSTLQQLEAEGALTLRVWHMIAREALDAALAVGLRSGFGGEWLQVGHLKLFADGALGSGTAEMLAPYEGRPADRGVAATSTEEIYDAVRRAAEGGIASAVHAIGDQANRRALNVFERVARQGLASGLRQRIEHAQLVSPEDMPRFAALGVIASMQPIHATQDMPMAERQWGERAQYGYAWRSLQSAGAALAFGTDCPVEALDPMANLYAAVTRRRPDGSPAGGWHAEQCLSLPEALQAYTSGAAYAAYQEHRKGTLTPGKLADMVVLSQDILSLPPEALLKTRVETTLVGGRVVYSA